MTGLDKIRELVTSCLVEAGIEAVTAWGPDDKKRREGVVAAVSLRGCQGGPGGFQDYLGERYNPGTGRWEELYGRKARLTFGLDLYAAGRDGGDQCQAAFDKMADALENGAPLGLSLESLSRKETVFDGELGLFRCPVEAVCQAWLYAVADEGGAFLDFEVRGERT